MKKTNRVIMVIVAVLLTLVLLSTSLVSGIFAKYVVSKDATTVVSFKRFGIQLNIVKGEDFATGMTMDPDTSVLANAGEASVTVTGVQLAPGDILDEIVRFEVSVVSGSKVSVNTKIKVKAELVSATNLAGSSTDTNWYLPIEFTATKNDATSYTKIADSWKSATTLANLKTTVNPLFQTGLKTALGTSNNIDSDGYAWIQIASAGEDRTTDLAVQSLDFGYHCPATSSVANSDAIMTYIAEQGGTFSVKYTVVLEQM